MKKIFIIALVLYNVILISSCKNEGKENTENKAEEIIKKSETIAEKPEKAIESLETEYNWNIYEGFMNNGLHIGMYLCLEENDSIHGYYFYSKHQKLIELRGIYIAKSGEYIVSEYYNSKLTGIFNLKNVNGKLIGSWQKNRKAEKQDDLELFFIENQKSSNPNIEFSYYENKHITIEYTTEEESEATDKLFLAKISPKIALFDYSIIGTNWHIGHVSGKLKYLNDDRADFEGKDNCQLSFDFSKNNVFITESDCQYYHGAQTYFDNKLTKK